MNKKEWGQYNTKREFWLTKEIKKFIEIKKPDIIVDPFAGDGDILNIFKNDYKIYGMDIDPQKKWPLNDSLLDIPLIRGKTLIITNPPYLYKSRSSFFSFNKTNELYFQKNKEDNLYLIALKKALEKYNDAIFIIPESFVNKIKHYKESIFSISVIEKNPFEDTDVPVCVVCFSKKNDLLDHEKKIYKNEKKVSNIKKILETKEKIKPNKKEKIIFNDPNGWLAVRLFDQVTKKNRIIFGKKDDFLYDWNKIKVSSRNYSLVSTNGFYPEKPLLFFKIANEKLESLRMETADLVLTAFKGNTKDGTRRRRLDFKTARFLIEETIEEYKKRKE